MDNRKIYRIIDANLNRAREGLRVIEDGARFIFNDKALTARLKKIRHELSIVAGKVYPKLIGARDSAGDVGASPQEEKRENLSGLLIANFRRVEEAVRVLEEFSRLISEEAGYKFKQIRFKMYVMEKKIMKKVKDSN
ncbi:MAG: thiamine-phosphate pyrophosphorylase [bacterium]